MGTKVNWIDIKDTLLGNHRKCFIWIRYVITLIAAFYGYFLKYIIGFFTNIAAMRPTFVCTVNCHIPIFSCVHATLQPTLSVCLSVGRSVGLYVGNT